MSENDKNRFDDPDADVTVFIELLFFAYRDFVSDPDALLQEYGFHPASLHPGSSDQSGNY